jgi:CDP-glucose 4,6-dehydratase
MQDAAPEIVFHMAAQPLVRQSYRTPAETYATNVMGTVNLLEAVRCCGAVRAVVNVTTDKCYENKEWIWGYREDEPLGGYDPYSSSKACSELVTAAYRQSFFNSSSQSGSCTAIASARAGNVIGGGDWAVDRLVPDCVRSLISGEEIVIRNPSAVRPWQHVLEPLSGYMLLAKRLFEEGPVFAEPWNFGPGEADAKEVEWIVNRMCRHWDGNSCYKVDSAEHPHEAHYLRLDSSKAGMRLGWRPRWDLDKAIDSIIQWTRGYVEGIDLRVLSLGQIRDYSGAPVSPSYTAYTSEPAC